MSIKNSTKQNKNVENRRSLNFFVFWRQSETFFYQQSVYLVTKPTGQQFFYLLTFFHIPIHELCRTLGKKCNEALKVENFLIFCHFRCPFEICWLENCHYLIEKAYWTTSFCRLERFHHANVRPLSKI